MAQAELALAECQEQHKTVQSLIAAAQRELFDLKAQIAEAPDCSTLIAERQALIDLPWFGAIQKLRAIRKAAKETP